MRIDCSCLKATATSTLETWIREVGLHPIVTPTTIRCLYEGTDQELGEAIVEKFEHEIGHDINVSYSKEEQMASAKQARHDTGIHNH